MAGSIAVSQRTRSQSGITRIVANIATDASDGSAPATVIGEAYGRIVGILYDPTGGAGATMDTSADLYLSDGDTGATLWSTSGLGTSPVAQRPTAVVTNTAGAAITADTSNNDVNRDVFVAGQLKLRVANGGNSKTGTFVVLVQG